MKKRLLIIRNPNAKTLSYIDTKRENQDIILVQNGVFSSELAQNGAKLLENDAKSANLENNDNIINYDEMLGMILSSELVITI